MDMTMVWALQPISGMRSERLSGQFKVGQLKPLFSLLFCPIFYPFWTQSTLYIGYLKLRCLIKALSLTMFNMFNQLNLLYLTVAWLPQKASKNTKIFEDCKICLVPRVTPLSHLPSVSGPRVRRWRIWRRSRRWLEALNIDWVSAFIRFHQVSPDFTRFFLEVSWVNFPKSRLVSGHLGHHASEQLGHLANSGQRSARFASLT